SLSFSKSVELHDKVIGHYLNIQHYQSVGVITARYYHLQSTR
ncbi:IS1 family transposase, partial [Klebsiella pneumoniae]